MRALPGDETVSSQTGERLLRSSMPFESNTPDDLPDDCLAVLYGLVTSFPGKGKTSLLKLLRTVGVADSDGKVMETDDLGVILERLQRQEWIELEQRPEGQYLCVTPQRRNRVILSLLEAPDCEHWLNEIDTSLPYLSEWQTPSRSRILQDLWLSLLKGATARLEQSLRLASYIFFPTSNPAPHPMQMLQADPEGLEVFARLDDVARAMLVDNHLNLLNTWLGPAGHSYALALLEMEARPS